MRIVYTSFGGRYADSPRALHEGLLARGGGHEHVWLAHPDHASGFPPGVTTAPATGPGCVEALERADVVVANTYVDLPWRKRAGALYLQTWHGTPLKRIHFDMRQLPLGGLGRLDVFTEDVRRWDVLVSASPASTPWLRRAFDFRGEVLEAGSPRNDVLSSPQAPAVRARVRAELGVPDGATAVLYTPTWRDDVVDEDGELDFALHLDLDDATRRLGPGHVLLVRLHPLVSDRLGPVLHAGVVDVSASPDVRELYLAADAMVTDYSSTMFDFAVTGKPLLLFPYDLARYRDERRGFTFDLFADAPGPVARTSEELVDALADLDRVRARHAAAYARFRERFCPLEDGRATERVLRRLVEHLER